MPVYTLELWRVMEMYDDIGLNDYPIFKEEYRAHLNKLITDHYHDREIGMETIEKFRHAVQRRLNEVMPYYNSLYKTQEIEYDPLSTIDIRTVTNGTATTEVEASGESTSEMENKGGSRAVQSNTPQVRLSGNGDYASNAADTTSDSTASGSGSESQTSTSAEESANDSRTSGFQGAASSLIMEYRRSLMNIDLLVIDELGDCFMGVWDNGDDILPYPYTHLPNLY